MNKFFVPKRGDTVRVRLASGEVVEAEYDGRALSIHDHPKAHWVKYMGFYYFASSEVFGKYDCVFVGPGAVMEERK